MGLEEMVVTIVFIGCASGVLKSFADAMGRRRSEASGEIKRILEELRELRADVGTLQQRNRTGSSSVGNGGVALTGDAASRLKMLEEEMTSLRDTTTQFDMSFDAALERLERRVDRMDGTSSVAGNAGVNVQPKVEEQPRAQVIGRG